MHGGDFLETLEHVSWANKPNPHFLYNHQIRAKTNCCKIVFEKGPSIFLKVVIISTNNRKITSYQISYCITHFISVSYRSFMFKDRWLSRLIFKNTSWFRTELASIYLSVRRIPVIPKQQTQATELIYCHHLVLYSSVRQKPAKPNDVQSSYSFQIAAVERLAWHPSVLLYHLNLFTAGMPSTAGKILEMPSLWSLIFVF